MNISHHTIRDCTPNSAFPAVQIPADPNQIQIFSQARYKLLANTLSREIDFILGLKLLYVLLHKLCNMLGEPLQVFALKTKLC